MPPNPRTQPRSPTPHFAQIEQLLGALAEEIRLLADVSRITAELRALIVKNEIGSIEQHVAQHQQLLQALAERGTRRTTALQEIAVRFDLKADDITVRGLAQAVGGELGQRLEAAADEINQFGEQIARTNRQNAAMVVQSADLTREVIQVLTNSDPGGNSYNAGGNRHDAVGRSMIELNG